jgi:signal transduction histidine kinase
VNKVADTAIHDLQNRLARRDREIEAARIISESLFQHVTIDALIERALSVALQVVEATAGSVLLADFKTQKLVFRYSVGEKPVAPGTALDFGQGIAGLVFNSNQPVIIADAQADKRHFSGIDALTFNTTRDMIALPLKRWEGEPIGVLEILNKRNGRLDHDDLAILTLISAFSAVAIQEARLFQEAKIAEVVRLLGDIGHDVKNLLMPVVMGAGLLHDEIVELCETLRSREESKVHTSLRLCTEAVTMLKDTSRRIQDRVKEIADCVKGLTAPAAFEECKVESIVEEVIRALQLMAREHGVEIRTESLQNIPIVVADHRRLFNAFYNLINNAIPEIPRGGHVTIRGDMSSDRQTVLLTVADTGRGMPADIRDSLFSSRAISRKPGGTGLGTKIVKDVVDLHGGTIRVESEVDRGTTFYISIPVLQPSHAGTGATLS